MIHSYSTNNRQMRKNAVNAIGAVAVFIFSFFEIASAQPITDRVDQAKFGKAQSYNNLEKPEKSLPLLKELYQQYPRNPDIFLEYVKALVYAGDMEGAKEFLKEFTEDYSVKDHDPQTTVRVVEFLGSLRLYDRSVDLCRQFLSVYPEDKDVLLWLARVLSWDQQYEESIAVYDRILAQKPDSPLLQRERARVLGWMRNYDVALKAYDQAGGSSDGNPALKAEMKAKKNFYRLHDIKAVKYYKMWLDLEPDHLEASFDLAQVYSRLRQWQKAQRLYEKVLKEVPAHPQAGAAYTKLKTLRDKNSFSAGYQFFEADSGSRLTDKRFHSLYAEIAFPVRGNARVFVRHTDYFYNFSDLSLVQAHTGELGMEFHPTERISAKAGYIFTDYTDSIDSSHNVFVNLHVKPFDIVHALFSYTREDVIENSASLKNEVRKDDLRLRFETFPFHRLKAGIDYGYAYYSDNNDRNTYGADASYHILFSPRQLTLRYRYESYGFDRSSANYFSPGSFHFNEIGIDWQHFLNDDELFWGSDDTYYTAGYSVNFDVKDQTGHRIYWGLHRDWSDTFATELDWSKKIYGHHKTYSEDSFKMSGILYF